MTETLGRSRTPMGTGGARLSAGAWSSACLVRGLTLLEVAVAMSILSVVTLATLTAILPISRQVRVSREMESAVSSVRKVFERVQATPFGSIISVYPQGTVIPVSSLKNGNVTVSYADPAANPLLVRLTVSWTSPDLGPMTTTFAAVRTD